MEKTQRYFYTFALLLPLLFGGSLALPSGPPLVTCASLTPIGHNVASADLGYGISTMTNTVSPGATLEVTITGNVDFKGLLLQVRGGNSGPAAAVGSWQAPGDGFQLLNCPFGMNSAVGHNNNNLKTPGVTFTWTAPDSCTPGTTYSIRATVVRSFKTVQEGLTRDISCEESPPFPIPGDTPPPPPPIPDTDAPAGPDEPSTSQQPPSVPVVTSEPPVPSTTTMMPPAPTTTRETLPPPPIPVETSQAPAPSTTQPPPMPAETSEPPAPSTTMQTPPPAPATTTVMPPPISTPAATNPPAPSTTMATQPPPLPSTTMATQPMPAETSQPPAPSMPQVVFTTPFALPGILTTVRGVAGKQFCVNSQYNNVPSGKYDTDFEDDSNYMGAWKDVGNTGWLRKKGATSSLFTGPSRAFDGKYYVYMEASSPTQPGNRAILESEDILGCYCLHFHFNFMVSSRGHKFTAMFGDVVLFEMSSSAPNNAWMNKYVQINSLEPKKIRLVAERGRDWMGDAALDKVYMEDGFCQ